MKDRAMNLNQTHGGAGQPPTTPDIGEIFGTPKENAGHAPHETGTPNTTTSESQYTLTSDTAQGSIATVGGNPEEQVQVFDPPAEYGIYGVKPEAWSVMAKLLGSAVQMLPTVCNPHAWNARGYKQTGQRRVGAIGFGKVPSMQTSTGVQGIKGWRERQITPEDIAQWSANSDHGILVRLGDGSGIVALDFDVDREDVITSITEVCANHFGPERWAHTPIRHRGNSARRTILFRVHDPEGRAIPSKSPNVDSVYREANGKGAFELLADGRQTLWAGTHPSGSRLLHTNLIPEMGLPVLSADEAIALWVELVSTFADTPVDVPGFFEGKTTGGVSGVQTDDPIGQWLLAQGLVQAEDDGMLHVDCPWQDKHTGGVTGLGSASWLPALTQPDGTIKPGRFHCMHTSCKPQSDDRWEFLKAVGVPEELYRKPATRVQADLSMLTGVPRPEGMPTTGGLSATPAAPKRYTLQSAEEFLSKPPISWYLRHILPRNGVQIVYGPSRAGKTFIVLDLVLSLLDSSRDEWFGHDIRNRPSGVAYLAMEGAYGVRGRVKAWATDNGGELPQNIRFMEGQAFNMLQAADVDALAAAVVEHFPQGNAITVIDTQAKAAAGADEQAAKDMGLVYLAAERIAQATRGLVILVAHTGKDVEKGIRGSSAQTGAADGMILVTRTNDNPDSTQADDTDDGENEVRTWKVVKCKDGPENATGAFKLQGVVIGHDADGEEVASAVVRETAMPKGKRKRATALKGNTKLIFETLLELIKQTSSTQIPKTLWRDAAYTKLSGDAKKKNQTFNRDGVNKLVEIGYVDKVSDTHYAVSLGVGIGLTEAQLPSANSISATVGV